MKIFVLNLAQSTDRLHAQMEQFSALGLDFERLPAVSVDDISPEFYQNHLTVGQRVMKPSEFACLFSHKKAWEQVIAQNQPCVILEDDAVLVKDFGQILQAINAWQARNIDFINLEVYGRQKIISKQPIHTILNGDYQIFRLLLDKSGTGGYILYPSGAKKLLARIQQTMGLADALIYGCPNLQTYQIEPAALLQSDKCQMYGVPFFAYPVHSVIGQIQNQHQINLSLKQKITLKKNRIMAQLILGFRTLKALCIGIKRPIKVKKERFFIHQNNK